LCCLTCFLSASVTCNSAQFQRHYQFHPVTSGRRLG
jgi:hypothetical protein